METGIEESGLHWASVLRAAAHPALWPGTQGNHRTSGASAREWASLPLPPLELCEKEHGTGTSHVLWSQAILG